MLIDWSTPRELGVVENPTLRFDRENGPEKSWPGRRLLFLHDKPAFELSHWCTTCSILFKRLDGANETLSQEQLAPRLRVGLDGIDDEVVDTFGPLLPRGSFWPMLITIRPQLVRPYQPGDYFSEEQVATWGISPFWGLPEYPQTPYYRTWQTAVDADRHLYEFVVPMVPPNWNDADTVRDYEQLLAGSDTPTAVAVSLLDRAQPACEAADATDYHEHWGLQRFLLDGHHKMQAAAQTGRPIRLLSLLSLGSSIATTEELERVPDLRSQAEQRRPDPLRR